MNAEGNVFITTSNSFSGEFSVFTLLDGAWEQKGNVLPTSHDKAIKTTLTKLY